MAFLLLIVLPLTYLGFAFEYASQKKWLALVVSIISIAICCPIYAWGVLQSRSSTAAIGLVFIPIFACTCGLLTFGYFYARSKKNIACNILAALCVLSIIVIYGFGVQAGLSEKRINAEKDQLLNQIAQETNWIQKNSSSHQGKENEWLRQELETRKNELGFQVAAVRSSFLEDDSLRALANSTDNRDLLAAIVVNKKTSPATIEAIFNKANIDNKLDVGFAMNSSTPSYLLDKVYHRSTFTDQWLASNLNTSRATLKKLASLKKMQTLVPLSHRNDLDCESLKEMQLALSDIKMFDVNSERQETLDRVRQKLAQPTCTVQ